MPTKHFSTVEKMAAASRLISGNGSSLYIKAAVKKSYIKAVLYDL